jgi:para-aminobenzoate synthetase component I
LLQRRFTKISTIAKFGKSFFRKFIILHAGRAVCVPVSRLFYANLSFQVPSIMREINLSADQLIASLLALSKIERVCFLDSCGVSHLGSHLLVAGINPCETFEISNESTDETLKVFEQKLTENFASFFTISYEFGLKLNKIKPRPKEFSTFEEPDIFFASFDNLIIHDYDTAQTFLAGNSVNFDELNTKLETFADRFNDLPNLQISEAESNFTRAEYVEKVEKIKELIRCGDTYQTNLTQQISADLPEHLSPQQIFYNLRKNNPAPFAAFLKRTNDFVISASPERFFKVENQQTPNDSTIISTSPIKGTRPRGKNFKEDEVLKNELINSAKDRAENVMIVDLLRNDLGRFCKFGSVEVEKLCDLEEHPTLFHLVSTIKGELRENTTICEIIRAVFPCGSITGAPKINTMRIIDRLETATRGLSMGAIGCLLKSEKLKTKSLEKFGNFPLSTCHFSLDSSVAIRTIVIRNNRAVFNVGGGVVIDSDAENEYEETLIKAKSLLDAINAKI